MKAILMDITPNKTYKTPENAVRAVEKSIHKFLDNGQNLRYFMSQTAEGRFFPVFVGHKAIHSGVHFYFNVIG